MKIKGNLVVLDQPVVMGILNVTPDSFYDGGSNLSETQILKNTEKMLSEGAAFIDLGGYSSRPGAKDVTENEERSRVVPAIKSLVKQFPDIIISVDTFRSSIANEALSEGASIINDISGGELDKLMYETVAQFNAPYILMHMRGTPQTMQQFTHYDDLVKDLLQYFAKKISLARDAGIKDIIIDPGFGFSKTIEQNFKLLNDLDIFKILELPILAGISRKSMISKTLNVTSEEALNGTTVINTIALMKGCSVLRVHDVKPAIEAIKIYNKIKESENID
ncbi:MAG: dihydropteroate synthase [Cytophagaceae bacterium]